MNKINCNVIGDLLPLYVDGAVSEDTKKLVEELQKSGGGHGKRIGAACP